MFGSRPALPSPRQTGLNRRAGMGMKLDKLPNSKDKALSGVFGTDFQKWAEIVYLSNSPPSCRYSNVLVTRKIHCYDSVGKLFYIRREWTFPLERAFRYD